VKWAGAAYSASDFRRERWKSQYKKRYQRSPRGNLGTTFAIWMLKERIGVEYLESSHLIANDLCSGKFAPQCQSRAKSTKRSITREVSGCPRAEDFPGSF
jgi:hypothetical protein